MADSGSTKNLTYSKVPKFDGEGTITLDAESVPRETGGTPRESEGTPRFKNKIRMSKDPIDDIFRFPDDPDSESEKEDKPAKKIRKRSPKPT